MLPPPPVSTLFPYTTLFRSMLERARQLAPQGLPVDFTLADATVYPFEPGRADLLFSRFGVMFFADPARSEEHTSELQSRRDLVCRLLLEKKKKKKKHITDTE